MSATALVRVSNWKSDGLMAVAAALLAFALHASSGFPTLHATGGDNDSLLRLVQVRDLIAGQGWFDMHQYRMGLDGGFLMHWSRLIDAPIATLVVLATAFTGSATSGEAAALVIWPIFLFGAGIFFLLRIVRLFGSTAAVLPALVIGVAAFHFVGIFAPGAIDHHNAQLVVALAMASFLVEASNANRSAIGAGLCAALMLAIGMETAPYVAVACLFVAGSFLVEGQSRRSLAIQFGLAFAVSCLAIFCATVSPALWSTVQCDAFSSPQTALAALGGAGLAGLAAIPSLSTNLPRRLAGLVVLGTLTATVAVLFFPQCLADPYAGLDPRLQKYWLGSVTEAQPIWNILSGNPAMAARYYITPILALACLVWGVGRAGTLRSALVVGAFLLTAILVSFWQVRGSMFSIPFAVIPLAAWVGATRIKAAKSHGLALPAMLAAWLLSFNVVWSSAAIAIAGMLDTPGAGSTAVASGACNDLDDYRILAGRPPTTVMAISNLGSPILRQTPHRVLAGPYHRNVEGNLVALSFFMEPAVGAEAIARGQKVELVATCPGNDESRALAEWAPGGLLADMMRGRIPGWLEAVPGTETQSLRLYRVRPAI